jgi:hypothetical protein
MKTKKKSNKPKLRSIKKKNRKLKKHKKTKRKQKKQDIKIKDTHSVGPFIGLTLLGETGNEIISELSSQKPVLKYKKSTKRSKLIRKKSGNLGNLVIPDSEFTGTGVEYKHTCDHHEIYQNDLQKFNLKLLAIELDEFFNIPEIGDIPGWWFPSGVPGNTEDYHYDNIVLSNSENSPFNPHINSYDPETFILEDAPDILDISTQHRGEFYFHIVIATLHEHGILHPKEYEKITHIIGPNYQNDMVYIHDHLDTDGDGISDKDEGAYSRHPHDTDGDGTQYYPSPDWLDNDDNIGVVRQPDDHLHDFLLNIHHQHGGGGDHDVLSPDQAHHMINGYTSQIADNIYYIQDVINRAVGRQKFLCLYKPGYYMDFHTTMASVISSTLNIHNLSEWNPFYSQEITDDHHPQPDTPDVYVKNTEVMNLLKIPEEWRHYYFTVDGESIEGDYLQGEWFFDENESHDQSNNRDREYHGKQREIIDKLTQSLHDDNHKILILSNKSQNSIIDKIHSLTGIEKHDIHIIVKPKSPDIVHFFKDEFKNNLEEYSVHTHNGLDHANHLEFYGTEHNSNVIMENMETERPIGHTQFNEIGYTIALATLYDNSEDTNYEIVRGISYGHFLITIAREGDGDDPDLPYKLRVQFNEGVLKKDDYLCNQDYIKERIRGILHIMTRYLHLYILKLLASHIGQGNDDQAYRDCLRIADNTNNMMAPGMPGAGESISHVINSKGKPCSDIEIINCPGKHALIGHEQETLLWRGPPGDLDGAGGITAGWGGCDLTCFDDLMEHDIQVFVHEFAHYIHAVFVYNFENQADSHPIIIDVKNKIAAAYNHFMSHIGDWNLPGDYKSGGASMGKYAKENKLEFFAVTTTAWFHDGSIEGINSFGSLGNIERFRTIETSPGNYYDLLTQLYGPSLNMKEELQSMNINVDHWSFR